MQKCVPFTVSSAEKSVPWYNDSLKRICKNKQRGWQKYIKNRIIVNYARYKTVQIWVPYSQV